MHENGCLSGNDVLHVLVIDNDNDSYTWGIPEIDSNSHRAPRDQCIFELLPEIGADTDCDAEINAN